MAKILIHSDDVVASSMAGPGIRYWEFAKALSKHHEITLAIPNQTDLQPTGFRIFTFESSRSIYGLIKDYEYLITKMSWPALSRLAKKHNTKIIMDAYDPVILENMEVYANLGGKKQQSKFLRTLNDLQIGLLGPHAFICASEKQRDFWLGGLAAMGRISPSAYYHDKSLRGLIDIVPFGIQPAAPKKTGEGFRKKFGIKNSDKVVIWGGGIWNWFDPLTLIRAMDKLSKTRDDIKLVFMGTKRPNDKVPEMEMLGRAFELSKELDLIDKHVFFNFGWVPYEERANYLLEADIGVSTHFDHLETRFSFRTRILDYFWAELPIVATKGDSMADLVEDRKLGLTVEYEDIDDLAAAIVKLADDANLRQQAKAGLSNIKADFEWPLVVKKILNIVDFLEKYPSATTVSSSLALKFYRDSAMDVYREKGAGEVARKAIKKIIPESKD